MTFLKLEPDNDAAIEMMSALATSIVREFFDPLIGKAQNDYMLSLFQTVPAIRKQLSEGYQYYFVSVQGRTVGFLAFYPKMRENHQYLYLSKFYLKREERGKGYARTMMDYVKEHAAAMGCPTIELNVNKHNPACKVYEALGFKIAREEKNDIGNGFFMDDYVYIYSK